MIGKKRAKQLLVAIAAASVVLLIAAAVFLQTKAFRQLLLTQLIQRAERSTGARVQIQAVALHWSPFTVDLYGIVVHGKENASRSPLFQAEHLGVSLGLRALLKRQIDLYSLTVDRPIVVLQVDSHGASNLPTAPPFQPSSFNVVIRHASILDGKVHFNDLQVPLAAELDNVYLLAAYNRASSMYQGSLGYGPGRILTRGMRPIEHKADLQFAVNGGAVEVNPLTVSAGHSQLTVRGKVEDFSHHSVQARYEGALFTGEVAKILKSDAFPLGEIRFGGSAQYQARADVPFLKAARVEGWLSSNSLALRTTALATSIQAVRANYVLKDGNLAVSDLGANILDGRLSGHAEMVHLDSSPASHVDISVRNLRLEKASDAIRAKQAAKLRLIGTANLTVQARWTEDVNRAIARARIHITGPQNLDLMEKVALPVNGDLDVTYDGAQQRASFGKSELRIAHTQLVLDGEISRMSRLNVNLNAQDLHELSLLAAEFSSKAPNTSEQQANTAYDLRGNAQISGQITGATNDPKIKAQITSPHLEIQGSTWRNLRVGANANSTAVELENGYVQSAGKGEIRFDGRARLRRWSFALENQIAVQAKLTKIPVADIEHVAKAHYPLTGDLSGDISVSGTARQPLGHGNLQLTSGSAWNEPIKMLNVSFKGDGREVQSTVQLQLPAGAATGEIQFQPETKRYHVNFDAVGLKLGQLQNVQQRDGIVAGTLTANVTGDGTMSDPQFSAKLQVPDLQVRGQKFSGLKADLSLAHQRATTSIDSEVEQGFVHAKGGVDLTGGYPAQVNIDVRALPIGPLLAKHSATSGVAQGLEGYTEIHASFDGPLKDPARLQGHLEIPRLNFAYQNVQLANDGPLRFSYSNGVARIQQARMRGTGSDLSLQGAVPVQSTIPLDLVAKGAIDVSLLQLLSPDIHSSGKIELDLRAGGAIKQPQTQGTIRIVNAGFAMEGVPTTVSALNAQLSISGKQLRIDHLEGTAGGGTVTANGSATYGNPTSFAVDLHAKGVRIRPTGVRSTLNGDLQLNGTPQKSSLTGQVVVDRLSFQEGFDLATFMSQVSDDSTVSTPSPFASNMKLGISIASSQNLSLASSQVSIAGAANLNVTGTAANPIILGRVTLTNGELFFQGKRFEIQNGTIAFANPAKTEPVLNLYVKTVVEQYNITINFSGPLDRLKTNYTSDPSLPPVDIINLLAFGQTSAEKASNASTPASLGAQSVLAQGVAGQVASRLQNLTGISQLTIDPTAGNSQNPGAQVAIQQRVTGTILFTFSSDVTSTQRQTVQLQYQPKPQWKISVVRDEYGGYGIDVRLHKVF